jgi:RNA polymerase sigma factor for flagellar operon FliA
MSEPDSPEVLARIEEAFDLVDMLARQLRRQFGPIAPVDELASQGREALLLAARGYDPSRGLAFRRWANLRIRGSMIDAIRVHGSLPRRVYQQVRAMRAADWANEAAAEEDAAAPPPSPEQADAALGEQLGSAAIAMALAFVTMSAGDAVDHALDPGENPEQAAARAELVKSLKDAIAERPEAERKLLERCYYDDVTIEEAGREMGLSRSWSCRLHARALEGVAKSLKRIRDT